MKIVCVDKKNDDGKWMKDWRGLGQNDINVVGREDFGELTENMFVFIHLAAMDYDSESPIVNAKQLIDSKEPRDGTFFLIVSGGEDGRKPWTSDDGWMHVSTVLFPNGDGNLEHLAGRFGTLLEALKTATDSTSRRLAWENFESHLMKAVPAVSILCQGYLAAWAAGSRKEALPMISELEQALEGMGWNRVGELGEALRERLGALWPEVQKATWWDLLTVTEFRDALMEELEEPKSETREGIDKLLRQLEDCKDSAVIQPDIIVSVYNGMRSILERSAS